MNLKQFSSCSNEHDSWYNSATLLFLWTQQQSILTDRKTYQHHQAFYVTLNVKGIVGYTIRICSATVSSRNKVFIIYEYLSETREERTVIVSVSPLHNNSMTFFRKFSAKQFNPIVVIQSLRTQLTSKCSEIQLCIRNMGCYRLCLSYFYITLQWECFVQT